MKKSTILFFFLFLFLNVKSQQDTIYYNKAQKENDNYKAIEIYTLAIKFCSPNSGELRSSYIGRGISKACVQDYYGAIEDLKTAINLEVNSSKIYWIVDKEYIIKLENRIAFLFLGDCFININDKVSGCLYYSKAGEVGELKAYDRIKKYCN